MTLDEYLSSNRILANEFASKIGVTESAVSNYRKGSRIPRQKILQKITELTQGQVTANDFVAAHPDKEGAAHG